LNALFDDEDDDNMMVDLMADVEDADDKVVHFYSQSRFETD